MFWSNLFAVDANQQADHQADCIMSCFTLQATAAQQLRIAYSAVWAGCPCKTNMCCLSVQILTARCGQVHPLLGLAWPTPSYWEQLESCLTTCSNTSGSHPGKQNSIVQVWPIQIREVLGCFTPQPRLCGVLRVCSAFVQCRKATEFWHIQLSVQFWCDTLLGWSCG